MRTRRLFSLLFVLIILAQSVPCLAEQISGYTVESRTVFSDVHTSSLKAVDGNLYMQTVTGLIQFDISNPASPVPVKSEFDLINRDNAYAVNEDYLVISLSDLNLLLHPVVDGTIQPAVSSLPIERSSYPIIDGDMIYLINLTGIKCLQIVDNEMVVLSNIGENGGTGLYRSGSLLVESQYDSCMFVSVEDPESPVEVCRWYSEPDQQEFIRVIMQDGLIIAMGHHGILFFDQDALPARSLLGSFSWDVPVYRNANAVKLDDILYVTVDNKLMSLDLSNLEAINVLDEWVLPVEHEFSSLIEHQGVLYAACETGNTASSQMQLLTFGFTEDGQLALASQWDNAGICLSAVQLNDNLYSMIIGGFKIWDLSANQPNRIGDYYNLTTWRGYLYLAQNNLNILGYRMVDWFIMSTDFFSFSLADPTQPAIEASESWGGGLNGMSFYDNKAYILSSHSRFPLTTPGNLEVINHQGGNYPWHEQSYPLDYPSFGVSAVDDQVVMTYHDTLETSFRIGIWGERDGSLTLDNSILLNGTTQSDITGYSNNFYAAVQEEDQMESWLKIYQRNQYGFLEASSDSLLLDGEVYKMKVLGTTLFIFQQLPEPIPGNRMFRLEGYDLSDPNHPQLVATGEGTEEYTDINARPEGGYLLTKNGALELIELAETGIESPQGGKLTIPESFTLDSPYPNPFNARVFVDIDLPSASQVSITIHNITGQEVAVLHQGVLEQGQHSWSWDASGVSSGIYFVAAVAQDGERQVRKMLLLR